ncbi:heterokaryon incompatibility protein-domain-containing protein [Clohesyomyces aquaticus]|uniref:Heterokaryon incompatibility protein-domain-containing protein n=1 Tax=Clohesyomyces aquaticus TaxID=1231657 RepID=A0A1Y1XYU3_9PLEO|nr:heterokaryon incompatibility protein-domain-containing protein [Clohesyomyces aquaticus]
MRPLPSAVGRSTQNDEMDSITRSDYNRYCEKCSGLFSSVEALEALASPLGYRHHTGAEAKASADRGCPLCQKLLIKWPDHISSDTDQLVCWAARGRSRCQTNPTAAFPETKVSVPYIFDGLICYRYGRLEHSHQRWVKTFTLFADSDDNAASLLPIRPPIIDVGSDPALRRARQLFEVCRDTHQLCPRAITPPLPTRAIDVGTIDSGDQVRLHITGPGELRDYVALSYCWGGPQPVVLTTENLKGMMASIPIVSLPQTVKDAIKVTRGLGIRFLWIDALCIIQKGNDNDKLREIGQMGKLYKNATVTIFAASAMAVSDGFLQPRTAVPSLALPFICTDGAAGTARLTFGANHNFMHPLNTRGCWYMGLRSSSGTARRRRNWGSKAATSSQLGPNIPLYKCLPRTVASSPHPRQTLFGEVF